MESSQLQNSSEPSCPPHHAANLYSDRHGAVAVRGDVGEAEIAGHQRVDQDAGGDGDQDPDRSRPRAPRSRSERIAFEAADDRADDGIERQTEGQQDGQRTQIFHITLY